MTKKELVELLNAYPDEMEVKVTWESLVIEIKPDNIYPAKTPAILLIDAYENYYKAKFQSGELEAL